MNSVETKTAMLLAFLVTLALAVPSLKQSVPLALPIQQVLMIVVLVMTLVHGHFLIRLNGRLRWFALACATLLSLNLVVFTVAIMRAGMWEDIVKQDFVLGLFSLLLLISLSGLMNYVANVIKRYIVYLMAIGCAVSLLGIYKLYLFSQGVMLDWVGDAAGNQYPWGTSLVSDYNFYSSTALIGMLAAMWLALNDVTKLRRAFGWGVVLVCLAAGFFAGSRRFWVLAPLASLSVALISKRMARGAAHSGRAIILLSIFVVAVFCLVFFALNDETGVFGADIFHRLESLNDQSSFSDRTDRWQFALDYLDGGILLLGDGFKYLYVYSQRFTGGEVLDYPHNPILSAAMYGGVIGFVFASLFYLFAMIVAIKLILHGQSENRLLGVMIIAQFFFVIISANSLFSISSFSCVVVIGSVAADLSRNPLYL